MICLAVKGGVIISWPYDEAAHNWILIQWPTCIEFCYCLTTKDLSQNYYFENIFISYFYFKKFKPKAVSEDYIYIFHINFILILSKLF